MIGGLGGLGQAVSTWMVEHGAKHLIYLSRTAGKTERDRAFFKELEAHGCSIQTFPGSVSVLSDVEYAVKNSSKPIAGVMQMSMVLRVFIPLFLLFITLLIHNRIEHLLRFPLTPGRLSSHQR
jgi:hypothetical protein